MGSNINEEFFIILIPAAAPILGKDAGFDKFAAGGKEYHHYIREHAPGEIFGIKGLYGPVDGHDAFSVIGAVENDESFDTHENAMD